MLRGTNGVIDYLKGFAPTIEVIQRRAAQGDVPCVCAVVREVYAGLSPAQQARAGQFFAGMEFQPTSRAAAERAGAWKYAFARLGRVLSITDCLIAAVAHAHGAHLATPNVRAYPMPEITLIPLPRPQPKGQHDG